MSSSYIHNIILQYFDVKLLFTKFFYYYLNHIVSLFSLFFLLPLSFLNRLSFSSQLAAWLSEPPRLVSVIALWQYLAPASTGGQWQLGSLPFYPNIKLKKDYSHPDFAFLILANSEPALVPVHPGADSSSPCTTAKRWTSVRDGRKLRS